MEEKGRPTSDRNTPDSLHGISNPADLQRIIDGATEPALVIFMAENDAFHEQMTTLRETVKRFEGLLPIAVTGGEIMDCMTKHFNIKGTPTFLLFVDGKIRDRLLGLTNGKTLSEFLERNLFTEPRAGTVPGNNKRMKE
jgi:thioredoxin-like negative regulator of GroEL